MISKTNIEDIYWTLQSSITVREQGDYSQFYAHLEQTFLEGVKNGCGNLTVPSLKKRELISELSSSKRFNISQMLCTDKVREENKSRYITDI